MEIVNIEDILEVLVSQHSEQVRRIGQDVKIKVEDSSNEDHFENLKFWCLLAGSVKLSFTEELAATIAQLHSALEI